MSVLLDEMKSHALEAQRFSRKHLVLELDFSENSMQLLEDQCDTVEYAVRGGRTPENIDMLTRVWGAYLGEALRRATAGEWFEETAGASRRIGIRSTTGEVVFPHEHVRKRLTEKGTQSLLSYFRAAREQLSK